MCQIAFSIPDEVLFDTKMDHEQANQFARRAVALNSTPLIVLCGIGTE